MIFVDTGYLVALLNPRDALRERARAWAMVINEELVVSEYVLVETANACSQGVRREVLHAFLARIRAGNGFVYVEVDNALLSAGLSLHASRSDKTWSLTDCISFLVMKMRGIARALAHDQHFEQAGFEALLRRDPSA
jgi:predicted nucleic acid-binding protein